MPRVRRGAEPRPKRGPCRMSRWIVSTTSLTPTVAAPASRARPRRSAGWRWAGLMAGLRLPEQVDPGGAQQPPEENEEQDPAAAAAAQLLRAVTRHQSAQQFAHRALLPLG